MKDRAVAAAPVMPWDEGAPRAPRHRVRQWALDNALVGVLAGCIVVLGAVWAMFTRLDDRITTRFDRLSDGMVQIHRLVSQHATDLAVLKEQQKHGSSPSHLRKPRNPAD